MENYLRNYGSETRIDKIQEVGKDLVDCGFLKNQISNEIADMLDRRDQLHHQVSLVSDSSETNCIQCCLLRNGKISDEKRLCMF